jgi:hypothetical protein
MINGQHRMTGEIRQINMGLSHESEVAPGLYRVHKIRQPLPKKRLKVYNWDMVSTQLTREDYKIFDGEYQVCLPIDTGVMIPKNDPVRILNAVFERMD